MKTKLSDLEIAQITLEAEARKHDKSLPIDVRIRSSETYAMGLKEADSRGLDYESLKKLVAA